MIAKFIILLVTTFASKEDLESKIQDLSSEIEELQLSTIVKDGQISALRQQLENTGIFDFSERIPKTKLEQDATDEIARLNAIIRMQQLQIQSLQSNLHVKDAECSLQKELEIAALKSMYSTTEAIRIKEIEDLKQELKEARSEMNGKCFEEEREKFEIWMKETCGTDNLEKIILEQKEHVKNFREKCVTLEKWINECYLPAN